MIDQAGSTHQHLRHLARHVGHGLLLSQLHLLELHLLLAEPDRAMVASWVLSPNSAMKMATKVVATSFQSMFSPMAPLP